MVFNQANAKINVLAYILVRDIFEANQSNLKYWPIYLTFAHVATVYIFNWNHSIRIDDSHVKQYNVTGFLSQ